VGRRVIAWIDGGGEIVGKKSSHIVAEVLASERPRLKSLLRVGSGGYQWLPMATSRLVAEASASERPAALPFGSLEIFYIRSMGNFSHLILDNQLYFITATTKGRRGIFSRAENAETMLKILQEIRERGAAKIYAFVLMPDHLHILLKPEAEPLAKIMQRIKGKAARLINQKEGKEGALWQREYYERAIRDESDLEEKYNYIVYNPVKGGLAEKPEDYPYSSAALKDMVDSV